MQTSPSGVAEIVGHEGVVLSPYRDSVGVWTFGVGHTAAAGAPDPATMARGIRQPIGTALEILRSDLRRCEDRVARAVKVPLAQHEFDALVSFDFNTGGIFRARLVRLLNAGDRAGAAGAFDGWHKPAEIIPRRNAEKRLFRTGIYGHGGMATLYDAGADGRIDWASGTRLNVRDLMAAPSRQPDDPGPERRPDESARPETGRPEGEGTGIDRPGIAGGLGAAIAAMLAFAADLAFWTVIAALVAGAAFLAWRYRGAIGGFLRRLGAGIRRIGGRGLGGQGR